MNVAIVHYWLVGMRGGERVLEALLDLYPDAVIVTHVYDPHSVSLKIRKHEVRQTFIGRLPGAKKHYKKYLPLMPLALENMDMQEFDLILSSEAGPAKGIIPRPDAIHISYCHSPMRYIWDQYHVYRAQAGRVARLMMPMMAHKLRKWDVSTAARVDQFVANSSFVRGRIKKFYRREADVIFPPVDTTAFQISNSIGDHYLLAGEMVPYKRADLAVEAFNISGRKLVVVGDGEMREMLERNSRPNITFVGRLPISELKEHFASCQALVFPGEEDFGIVPVEVMACGRPVIAFGRGGVLDTVAEGVSGVLFHEQSVAALNNAIDRYEKDPSLVASPQDIRELALGFDVSVFRNNMTELISNALEKK